MFLDAGCVPVFGSATMSAIRIESFRFMWCCPGEECLGSELAVRDAGAEARPEAPRALVSRIAPWPSSKVTCVTAVVDFPSLLRR